MQPEELKLAIQKIKAWQRGDQSEMALSSGIRLTILKMSKMGLPSVLCTTKMFDRRVSILNNDMVFQVAENAYGKHGMEKCLLRYLEQKMRIPIKPEYYLESDFIKWHVREVL